MEYRSLATEVVWHGGAADLFTALLPERHVKIDLQDSFVVRVVSAELALAARGFPKHVTTELTIELDDGSLPEASGTFVLRVRDGRGEVTNASAASAASRARGPRVTLDERGLAALYTGYLRADVLARAEWLDADTDTKALLDTLFVGQAPAMRDMF